MLHPLKKLNLLLGVFVLLIFACDKWDFDRAAFIQIITVGAIEVGSNDAFLLGDIDGLRNTGITETGFVLSSEFSSDESLQLNQSGVIQGISPPPKGTLISEDQAFAARIANLHPQTKYYFRAYANLEGDETAYGFIDTFTTSTLLISVPTIIRNGPGCSVLTSVTVTMEGLSATSPGVAGIVWSNDASNMYATVSSGITMEADVIDAGGTIKVNLEIGCNTTYYIRGYFQSENQKTYGPIYAFTTIAGGLWIEKSRFPGVRRKKPVIFSIGKNGYLGGGSQAKPDLKDMWTYIEEIDSWTSLGDFENLDIREAANVVVDGKAYIFNGLRSNILQECAACDCRCRVQVFPGGPTTPPFVQRTSCFVYNHSIFEFDPDKRQFEATGGESAGSIDAVAFNIHTTTYLIGGERLAFGGSDCIERLCLQTNNSYELDTKEEQGMDPLMGVARFHTIGFSLENRGYAGMGLKCPGSAVVGDFIDENNISIGAELEELDYLSDFYEFNPSLPSGSQWQDVTPFPGEGWSIAAIGVNDSGYVIMKTPDDFKHLWQFNRSGAEAASWKELADLPTGVFSDPTGTFSIGNRPYVYSNDGRSASNFWMYIPELQ